MPVLGVDRLLLQQANGVFALCSKKIQAPFDTKPFSWLPPILRVWPFGKISKYLSSAIPDHGIFHGIDTCDHRKSRASTGF